MSTNHTPNYNLSQWEHSDKVLMDDFNADNAKIDAALSDIDRRAGFKLIRETVLEEPKGFLSVPFQGISWEDYGLIIATCELSLGSGAEVSVAFGGAGIGTIKKTGSYSTVASARIFVAPMFSKETRPLFFTMGLVEDKFFNLDGKFVSEGSLFLTGYSLGAGSYAQIWGLR